MERTHRHWMLGVVLASLSSVPAQAESPPGNMPNNQPGSVPGTQPGNQPGSVPGTQPGKPVTGTERMGTGKADSKAPLGADRANQNAARAADKADKSADKASNKADQTADTAGARMDKPSDGSQRAGADNSMSGQRGASQGMQKAGFQSGLSKLSEEVRNGSIKREEVKERLEKLRSNMTERRREHREALRARWGSTLAAAPARDEVALHGRRMAMLNRAMFLAQTEAKSPNQEKLLGRIDKLIERENQRHEGAMNDIKSMPAPANTVAANNPGSANDPGAMRGSDPAGNKPSSMPGSNSPAGTDRATGNNPGSAKANQAAADNRAMGTKGAEK